MAGVGQVPSEVLDFFAKREEVRAALPKLIEELPRPDLKDALQALSASLTAGELPLTVHDLARLGTTLMNSPWEHACVGSDVGPPAPQGTVRATIFAEDGTTATGRCSGPAKSGKCPKAQPDRPLGCAGRLITAVGWSFRVPECPDACPLLSIGIISAPELPRR